MRPSAKIKQTVIANAGERCEYCRCPMRYSPDPFSAEHIVPQARGGGNDPFNLALSCQGCNNLKFTSVEAIDPITGTMYPLFHPRQHVWTEHFAWSEDFTQIVGLTATGRATIEKLQLNREGVMNLRRALHAVGAHPPAEDVNPTHAPGIGE